MLSKQELKSISEQLESMNGDINNENGESYKTNLEEQKELLADEMLANTEYDDIQKSKIESDFEGWTTEPYVDVRDTEPNSSQKPIPYLEEFTNTENIEIF